jgi:hypothetical protein
MAALDLALSAIPYGRVVFVVATAVLVVVLSLPGRAPARGVGLSWQVPRGRRLKRLGRNGTMALWGGLLGIGMLTVIPNAVVLLLPASVVAANSATAALLAGVVYGLARATLAGTTAFVREARPDAIIIGFPALQRRLIRANTLVAPAAVTVVLVVAVL